MRRNGAGLRKLANLLRTWGGVGPLALFLLLAGCGKSGPANGGSRTNNAGNAGGATAADSARNAATPLARHADGKTLVVSFLNIGQGDSAVVETPGGKTVLIDAGLPGSDDEITGYLKQRGIARFDAVIESHPHNDHIGGMAKTLDAVPFGPVYLSGLAVASQVQERFLTTIKAHGGRVVPVRAGQRVPLDDVKIDVLAPTELFQEGQPSYINNSSVVVRVAFGKSRFLFTGDMESQERDRLYASGADLRADILKVAHHGSHNGTDADFLNRVKPQVAVISCATGNDYGHPHIEALQALRAARVSLYRTDLNGTVTVSCDDQAHYNVRTERAASPEALNTPGQRGGRSGGNGGGSSARRGRGTSAAETSAPPVPMPPGDVETGAAFVGNRRSKIYHAPDAASLPAPANRVYFRTRDEAEAAGYRAAGDVTR